MFHKKFAVVFAFALLSGCTSAERVKTDSGVPDTVSSVREVSVDEAAPAVAKAYSQFIDVRTPEEYAGGHAARAVNMPLDTIQGSQGRLERNEPVYLICETGNRSKKAAAILRDAGFNNVLSVRGGTQAWRSAGLPMEDKPPHFSTANRSL